MNDPPARVVSAPALHGKSALVVMERASLATDVVAGLSRAGARVAVCLVGPAARAEAIASAERDEGRDVQAIVSDLADRSDIASLAARAATLLGSLDIVVVQPPGTVPRSDLLEVGEPEWSAVVSEPMSLTLRLLQAASRAMIDQGYGGRIIVIMPCADPNDPVSRSTMKVVRDAHHALVAGFADGLGRHDVTVNGIDPGCLVDSHGSEPLPATVAESIPKGRGAVPADIAPLVTFLASDAADYITGAVIPVDGGRCARSPPFPGS